jgi:hypothetical protein
VAKAVFGNHSSVLVPRQDRDSIRRFYCDVLGGKIMKADPERDFVRLGDNFYIGFLYGDVADESEFLRSFRAIWLEIKSHDVEEMSREILESGLVRKLEVPDPHFYFQAPGGQCLRLVGVDEDLSFYEGAGAGPNVAKVKQCPTSCISSKSTPPGSRCIRRSPLPRAFGTGGHATRPLIRRSMVRANSRRRPMWAGR